MYGFFGFVLCPVAGRYINYKNKPLLIVTIGLLIIIGMTGCKNLVQVDPPVTSITGENVYTNDATAIAAVTGIYANMSKVNSFATGSAGISLFAGLSADELTTI